MELFRVPDVRRRLAPDPDHCVRIEASELGLFERQPPPELHGAGPALLQRGVVQEGEGLAVQDLVSQH